MAITQMVTAMLLAATLAVGWAGGAVAATESDAKAAFDRAMAAVAASPKGSGAEARAMEQAIIAAHGLAAAPAIPDEVAEHAGRARAAAQAARTQQDFLDAAGEFDEAARLAPWVPEHQFDRGVQLEKAGRYGEAATALELYLKAAPDAADRTKVRELIASLRRLKENSTADGNNPAPPQVLGPPPSAARHAGEAFRDCPDCPEMVVIPAGRFVMGSPAGEPGRFDAEGPQHPVSVRSFALGRYDVTVSEFAAFVRETKYGAGYCDWPPGTTSDWQTSTYFLPPHPVVCVSWHDAQAYVTWLNGKVQGRASASTRGDGPYRLPSEVEWEYAARAGTRTARWWGDAIGAGNANCNGCGSPWDNSEIAPAGGFRPNPFGLYGMLGNVWQWTDDCWNESYQGAPSDGSAWTTGNCRLRVIRGGSWSNLPRFIRSAARNKEIAVSRGRDYATYAGFRVARTLP